VVILTAVRASPAEAGRPPPLSLETATRARATPSRMPMVGSAAGLDKRASVSGDDARLLERLGGRALDEAAG